MGEKPVTAELVETALSRQLDDLEPTLTRHGYRLQGHGGAVRRQARRNQGAVQQLT
jgi:hypothetical protein